MTENEMLIENLQQENKELKKELDHYKALYAAERDKKIDMEQKLELAKEKAKKGIDVSKDIFKVTKSVLGKAKDSLKEEWNKQQAADQVNEADKPSNQDEKPKDL